MKSPVALRVFDDYGHFCWLHMIRLSRLPHGNRGQTQRRTLSSVCLSVFTPADLLQMETTALGRSRCDVIQKPNGSLSFLWTITNMAVVLSFIQLLNDPCGWIVTLSLAWMKAIQDDGSLIHLCGNQARLFFFSCCYSRYWTRPVCCVSQTTGRTPDLNPSLNLLRSERVWFKGRADISGTLPVCDVEFQSWETLGRVLFIHSRLNMSVSGWYDNGCWWSYIWTYLLCGKHVQDFLLRCQFVYKCINILNFSLGKTWEDHKQECEVIVLYTPELL